VILVRAIFHLKFGKAKDPKVLLGEAKSLGKEYGFSNICSIMRISGQGNLQRR
jgi:hypothetical protein